MREKHIVSFHDVAASDVVINTSHESACIQILGENHHTMVFFAKPEDVVNFAVATLKVAVEVAKAADIKNDELADFIVDVVR